jgi:SAM-dependent methyltransferase
MTPMMDAHSGSALLGPAFPDQGWVPAPRYLMRRARILDMLRDVSPGRVLEVGPGAATLLMELAAKGFRCEGLEPSQEAHALASRLVQLADVPVALHTEASPDWTGAFDALFAFDVLEHIEDDRGALQQWRSWLKPGGTLLLSVPARQALWTAGDEWAGHFRRYEWAALVSLLDAVGFDVHRFECYGFPLTNLSERVSARAYRNTMRRGDATAQTRQLNNDRSGVDRRPVLRLYPLLSSLPGRMALRTAMAVQNRFLGRDWGSGYVLSATARGA